MASADRLIEIFNEAKSRPRGLERNQFLAEACCGNHDLKAQILSLLDSDERSGNFLDAASPLSSAPVNEERPGDWIGRYRLQEKIGEGGCGAVYMAEQLEPVRRQVALKIIKLGMDTRAVVARFEVERQALAVMDHPNIAKVLDGGTTLAGRPYFVMELVRGVRITEFCDEANLSTTARLHLFVQVCYAIRHAHQKGIIHRDLKPSNILVTVNDGVPVPKVIDFGIAKATGERLTDKTLFTQFHAFIGTPAYTSPEQAQLSSVDVDTRSDIYSLGVLLYELLTGRTPFDAEKLQRAGIEEMCRVIRNDAPARPSTRLQTLGVMDATALGERRTITVPELARALRGDLDCIVMKCLEKDRARRYETASALAADVKRHLDHEPIQARPVGVLGRLWRWRLRRPAIAALSASVLLLLTALAVGSAAAVWRVMSARQAEHAERSKAEVANRDLLGANTRLADAVNVLELRRVEDFLRANDSASGVAHLAAMLRRDSSNHIAASRIVSALVHRDWALPAVPPIHLGGRVPTVNFSPDGRHVLSSSWDKSAQIHDASTGELLVTVRHDEAVHFAAYDLEGRRFVTASADRTARIWNATNGVPLTPPLRHMAKVSRAEFSRDGKIVLTTSAETYVRLWDAASGALKRELRGHNSEILVAALSPDAKRIVTASATGSLRIWDTDSGQALMQLDGHFWMIYALAFSPDGKWFATAGRDSYVQVWDITTGERRGPPLHHGDAVRHVSFSPDAALFVTGSQDDTARLWSTTNSQATVPPLLHEGGVIHAAFSSDGKTLVTASFDNSARLWDVRTGRSLCQPLRQLEAILHASFSPDGRQLVTGSWDQTVQIWNIEARRFRPLATPAGSRVSTVAFDPSGDSVASASDDNKVRLWNARSGKLIGQPLQHPGRVCAVAYSADGKRIITAGANGAIFIWDSITGASVASLYGHSNTVWTVQFSPDDGHIVTGSEDETARVFDAKTGELVLPPLEHGAPISSARYSPNGRWIATASDNWSARVWDAKTGTPVTERLPHGDHVEWAEFSADSERLVSASSDNTARVWETRTGKPVTPPLQHSRTVQKAIFSPDGRHVLTASLDRTARVWDANTGESLTGPMRHDRPVAEISYSPDGARILTACWSGKSRLWDAATGRPLTEWLDGGGFGRTADFDATGTRIVTGSDNGIVRIWDVPAVPTPVPGWFVEFAESVAGMRLTSRGNAEWVPRRELEALSQRLARESEGDFYVHLGRWFLANPSHRSASPF